MSTLLDELLSPFVDPAAGFEASMQGVEKEEIPQPCYDLLVHNNHMTVALEKWYGSPVEVVVLREELHEPYYSRVIQLRLVATNRLVEYGIMRVDLRACGGGARAEILTHAAPLGRILIDYGLLTDVVCESFLEIAPFGPFADLLDAHVTESVYGRTAAIYANECRVVDLLEIMPRDVELR